MKRPDEDELESHKAGHMIQIGDELESRKAGHMICEDLIGRGGMGTVFGMMRDEDIIPTRYALKTISPIYLSDPQVEKNFAREARMVGLLNNLRIVRIHNYLRIIRQGVTRQGTAKWVDAQGRDGIPCIVMDRLQGDTLDKLARGKTVSVIDLCKFASDLLEAIRFVHEMDMIHRDIKPGNIFMRTDGVITLIDFGIGLIVEHEKREKRQDHYAGTPNYSAYEQLTNGIITLRTDLYAIGVVFYELLTGRHPYLHGEHRHGDRASDALLDLAVAPVHLLDIDPTIPRPIADVIMSSLSRKAEERPKSGSDFARAFRRHMNLIMGERERNRHGNAMSENGSSSEGDLFSKIANSPQRQGEPQAPGPTGTVRTSFAELRARAAQMFDTPAPSVALHTTKPPHGGSRPALPPTLPSRVSAAIPEAAPAVASVAYYTPPTDARSVSELTERPATTTGPTSGPSRLGQSDPGRRKLPTPIQRGAILGVASIALLAAAFTATSRLRKASSDTPTQAVTAPTGSAASAPSAEGAKPVTPATSTVPTPAESATKNAAPPISSAHVNDIDSLEQMSAPKPKLSPKTSNPKPSSTDLSTFESTEAPKPKPSPKASKPKPSATGLPNSDDLDDLNRTIRH